MSTSLHLGAPRPTRPDRSASGGLHIALVSDTYPPEFNGASLVARRMVEVLRARGHRVEIARLAQSVDASNDETDELRLPFLSMGDLRLPWRAGRALRQRWRAARPDAVHIASDGVLGWIALRQARALGIPVSTDFRADARLLQEGFLGKRLAGVFRRAYHNAGNQTFVANYSQSQALVRQGLVNLAVVGRGVDTECFRPERRSRVLRRRWGAGDGDLVVLHVGRLSADKNPELVARAFAALQRVRPRARMVWIGDGPLRARLQARHPDHLFLGERAGEALASCYASADLFVYAGSGERFGNAILEAMASGLAVLTFDRGAAAEHCLDGVDACVVPCGDEAAFVERAADLARMPAALERLRSAARAAVRALRWSVVMGEFEQRLLRLTHREATVRVRQAR